MYVYFSLILYSSAKLKHFLWLVKLMNREYASLKFNLKTYIHFHLNN